MLILVYSETTASNVAGNLGRAEYSYYFILEKYLPVLCTLGEVVLVNDPAREVDDLYDEACAAGRKSVFLSFTPPHCTAKNLRCPTVCVLAWEFDSIPCESWDPDEPWNNWVEAIGEIGNVITISNYATRVIRKQVGRGVRVATIPAPVVADETLPTAGSVGAGKKLVVTAGIVDTLALDIDTGSVTPRLFDPDLLNQQQSRWDGHPVDWCFSSSSGTAGQYLVGFYSLEDWGCWSMIAQPSIILPWSISGEFELTLELLGYGENIGRTVTVSVGASAVELQLGDELHQHRLTFSIDGHANSIRFSGISAIPAPGARDHRTLGLGLRSLSLRRTGEPADAGAGPDPQQELDDMIAVSETALEFAGPVYASVFNPMDGRKNWHDMVTAFCWAFRHDPSRTLVLKMSHHNRGTFLGELLLLFSRLSPFQCRVIAIHGYLDPEQLQGLVAVSDYFVNSSLAEGQCLPLLEFMAQGVPAISPDHTAMASYINDSNAFVVRSSAQPYIWPNDPRRVYRTVSNRIDWDSLHAAYLRSAQVQEQEPRRYQSMSASAAETVRKHYSTRRVGRDLKRYLKRTVRRGNR